MRKLITTYLLCLSLTHAFGQKAPQSAIYLTGGYNHTLYDVTQGNNPWSMGVGLQLFLRPDSKIRPTVDVTADAYLENDKVALLDANGVDIDPVGGMVNVFAGGSYHPVPFMYVSFVAGPSFVGGGTRLGVKPSLGFYFAHHQNWTARLYYINIFKRYQKADFGSLGVSLGIRLH